MPRHSCEAATAGWFELSPSLSASKHAKRGQLKLYTKDWDEALIRCAERNLHYERAWRDLETGFGGTPDELAHRQIVALAGEFYCEMVVRHSDDPE